MEHKHDTTLHIYMAIKFHHSVVSAIRNMQPAKLLQPSRIGF